MEKTKDIFLFNLRRLREESGMTQAKLAGEAEISLSGYAKIEYGDNWPTPATLDNLAKALGHEISEFFLQPGKQVVQSSEQDKKVLFADAISTLSSLDENQLRSVLTGIRDFMSMPSTRKPAKVR